MTSDHPYQRSPGTLRKPDDDPYKDESLKKYPSWWQNNIKKFRESGLPPYRPPRFSDGRYSPEVISELESEHNISIQLRCINPQSRTDWEILVDGNQAGKVGRTRKSNGYSLYKITSEKFESMVKGQLQG
jgi:hypothetical protein